MSEDPRKAGLKDGLRQLRPHEIYRLLVHLDNGQPVLLDRDAVGHANYDGEAFCPLAVATGCAEIPEAFHSDNDVVSLLTRSYGFRIYNTRGIAGDFYTTNRRRDLAIAAREVLAEKEKAK